jgi:integrase
MRKDVLDCLAKSWTQVEPFSLGSKRYGGQKMALEMKETSQWWYARILVNGKLRRFPLMEKRGGMTQRIKVQGKRPESVTHPEHGDARFLESYHRAKAAHDRLLEEELSKRNVEELTQRIIESKTGARLDLVKVEATPEAWEAIPRKRKPSRQYVETAKGTLRRFVSFMRKSYPLAEDLAAVQSEHVRAFLDGEAQRGISPRTWNISLKLLKTVFRRLEPSSDAYRSFLKDAAQLEEKTIHREPFKEQEIMALLAAAKGDDLMRPLIVTALCTAMRRGDCARLKWANVDMDAGFIEIPTSKTGETAEIPILPALREELNRLPKTGSDYVFPAAAELYRNDRHALDRRLRVVMASAGLLDKSVREAPIADENGKVNGGLVLPKVTPDEMRKLGAKAIATTNMSDRKREHMRAIFGAYIDGKSIPRIAHELGISKSTVSLHLNHVQRTIGVAVLRRKARSSAPVSREKHSNDNLGGSRLKRGSIRGWHSFRVAFVTRALSGGMAEELVRRVTGHSAVDVVRKHYFKPGREEFRRAFEKAMPQMLMSGAKSRDNQLTEIIERMTPKTLKVDKVRALAILRGI